MKRLIIPLFGVSMLVMFAGCQSSNGTGGSGPGGSYGQGTSGAAVLPGHDNDNLGVIGTSNQGATATSGQTGSGVGATATGAGPRTGSTPPLAAEQSGPSTVTEPMPGTTGAIGVTAGVLNGAAAEGAADRMLTQRVRAVLDPGLAGSIATNSAPDTLGAEALGNIQVSSSNGIVVLRGAVRTEEQREDIARRVHGVAGVRQVKNEIQVLGAPATP